MSYTKTTWINNQAPAINAANLNKIEEGISAADTAVTALETRISALESADGVSAGYVPTAQGDGTWEWAQGGSGDGLTDGIKQALLQIAQKVAYVDEHGQDYYDDLYDALYAVTAVRVSPTSLSFSTLGSTQQLTATTTPSGANVTWASSNTSVATVDSTGLVTSVGYGSAMITATAGSITASCAVVVAQAELVSISAVYTQSGTVYDTDALDTLKSDLVVTATYGNSTTQTLADTDYTLSGTLAEGTSTVTVAYGGKTTTFTVTVTHKVVIDYTLDALDGVTWLDDYTYNANTGVLTATSGEHCTEKFSVQDISYQLSCSDGKSTYIALFIWDSDGNFLGREEKTGRNMTRMQLKPDYQYAVKIYNNTNTFDSNTVTMLPVDKRATAVEQMSIVLTDYLDAMTAWNNGQIRNGAVIGEINVATHIPSLANYSNAINRVSVFSAIGESVSDMPFADILKTSFYTYSSTQYFHITKKGITTLEDLKSYITYNNIVIEINY